MTSECAALVIQALAPSSRQPPSTGVAVVAMLAKSLPAPGSVSAVEPNRRPAIRSARYRSRWVSLPSRATRAATLPVFTRLKANGIDTALSTSTMRHFWAKLIPSPPSSAGTSMASSPISEASRRASGAMRFSLSQRFTFGATTVSRNWATSPTNASNDAASMPVSGSSAAIESSASAAVIAATVAAVFGGEPRAVARVRPTLRDRGRSALCR